MGQERNYDMKKLITAAVRGVIIIGAVFSLIPFVWMLITSLNDGAAIYKIPPQFILSKYHIENYAFVFEKIPFKTYFLNSVLVSFAITIGTLLTTIPAAFAFTHFKFKGRDFLFIVIISTMMIPSEILLAPNFVMLTKLKLINTLHALYIPWIASAFSVFMLRQYFLDIPKELYHSAQIDGCGDFKYLWEIAVPYAKPALVSIALLRIINSWNEFLWPLLMVNRPEKRTLPVGLTTFMTEAGPHYHYLMAYSAMVIVPVIVIYLFLQKHLIEGFSRSGIAN